MTLLPCIPAMPEYFTGKDNNRPEDRTKALLQSAFKTDAVDAYEFWRTQPKIQKNFMTFMEGKFTPGVASSAWTDVYPCKERIIESFDENLNSPLFVDVGGSNGHEAERFLELLPDETRELLSGKTRRIHVQDCKLPDPSFQKQKGRIEYQEYDFFTPQPLHKSSVYFFSDIFHNWSDEKCGEVLENLKDAMEPGYSRLLISDHILPATGCPFPAFALDISMMVLHAGKERTLSQWKDLLSSKGFTYNEHWLLPDGRGVIEAMIMYG
jgi:hypothetical protein